jgi:hypothetical protein
VRQVGLLAELADQRRSGSQGSDGLFLVAGDAFENVILLTSPAARTSAVWSSATTDPVSRPAPEVLPAVLVLDREPLPPCSVGADEMLLLELVRGRTARDQQVRPSQLPVHLGADIRSLPARWVCGLVNGPSQPRLPRRHRGAQANQAHLPRGATAKTFLLTKTFRAPGTNFFRQEKSLRDHGDAAGPRWRRRTGPAPW